MFVYFYKYQQSQKHGCEKYFIVQFKIKFQKNLILNFKTKSISKQLCYHFSSLSFFKRSFFTQRINIILKN